MFKRMTKERWALKILRKLYSELGKTISHRKFLTNVNLR